MQAPYHIEVPENGTYSGQIPGWGTGELVALVSARVVSSSQIETPASSTFSTPAQNATQLVLHGDTLIEHTDKVNDDGRVSVSLKNGTSHASKYTRSNSRHFLFAYYQYQDLAKNLDIESNTTGTIFDNGSYTVDHYSARGAETTKEFWENHILNDTDTRSLLAEVGTYGWEDSLEIKSNISWSPSLPERFQKMHGYRLQRYLPLLMYGNNNPGVQTSYPGSIKGVLENQHHGNGFVNDFRAALAQGYGDYLSTLTTWLEGMGLGYSAQISYNLPIDMETNIDKVTAPECESLAFNDNIDGYRQFSGPANVAQKSVISNEMGADMNKALRLPISELLSQISKAFVGGVNQVVLHGQTFTGDYYETTWPGYLAFFLLFSESYMNKQPAWKLGMPDAISYINRNQFVLHQGQPRTDVAFYTKVSYTDPQLSTLYTDDDLVRNGYTYSYLNPNNLNSSRAYVSDGLLAPESPAYQALVLTTSENITLEAVSKIRQFADAGLMIIFDGGLPGYYASGNGSEKSTVNAALKSLQGSKNVHTAQKGQLAAKLKELDIRPRVEVSTFKNATWYPVLRSDESTDYVFLFSEGSASSGHVLVNSTKTPYILNSWTGERAAILNYQVQGQSTKITLSLAADETVVLAFSNDWESEVATPSSHAVRVPSNLIGYNFTSSRELDVHVTAEPLSIGQSLRFSNGKTYNISGSTSSPSFSLGGWKLVAEHWEAPKNMSDATIIAEKHNTTHHLDFLISWLDIPGLHNASGIGNYSTQFSWPPTASADATPIQGAYISLPQISHGLKLFINGHPVQNLNFAKPMVDIGPFLRNGSNSVVAVVPTLMWNYISSIYQDIEISGSKPMLTTLPDKVDTGLIGEARVIPYTVHHIPL